MDPQSTFDPDQLGSYWMRIFLQTKKAEKLEFLKFFHLTSFSVDLWEGSSPP